MCQLLISAACPLVGTDGNQVDSCQVCFMLQGALQHTCWLTWQLLRSICCNGSDRFLVVHAPQKVHGMLFKSQICYISLQVRGKNVPRPVRNWNQCGLSSRVVDTLRKAGMTEPMPIQVRADRAVCCRLSLLRILVCCRHCSCITHLAQVWPCKLCK